MIVLTRLWLIIEPHKGNAQGQVSVDFLSSKTGISRRGVCCPLHDALGFSLDLSFEERLRVTDCTMVTKRACFFLQTSRLGFVHDANFGAFC